MSTRLETEVKALPPTRPPIAGLRAATLQRKCACGGTSGPDGECAACRAKRLSMQRNRANGVDRAALPSTVHEVLHSSGQPLDATTRGFMEARFGHDFGHVRVHTDARAAESARAVQALAYTVGRDLVFASGHFAPTTSSGQRLLAHELAHVIQQGGARQPAKKGSSSSSPPAHRALQRQPEPDATEGTETPGVTYEDLDKEQPSGPATIESSTDETLPEETTPEETSPEAGEESIQTKAAGAAPRESSGLEREADVAADSILAGRSVAVRGRTSPQPQYYLAKICDRASTQFPDFPKTYISAIKVDLTSPKHNVSLTWTGPNAAKGNKGPFHSSPGAGKCARNCDKTADSRAEGSLCTPKGNFVVHSFGCDMSSYPEATNVTYFSRSGIALHYYPSVPSYPASHGCVRIASLKVAQLIYDNSKKGTTVSVSGTWKRGKRGKKPVCY